MISPYKVPAGFSKLIKQCYVAVPAQYGGGMNQEGRGFINGFHDMRVIRDLYELWRHLHAKAANLSHQIPYYSCHDEENLAKGDMDFWEREICTILNCKFAGNATFEWWERKNGEMERTMAFPHLPTPNHTQETLRLFSQPILITLFDHAQHDVRTATKIIKGIEYDPVKNLIEDFDLRPDRIGEYRLFAPIELIMKGKAPNGFVPYISTSSTV